MTTLSGTSFASAQVVERLAGQAQRTRDLSGRERERDRETERQRDIETDRQTDRLARFYLLPKIHKPGNPGRSIVSSNNSPTENISQYVDHFLRPLVRQQPGILRDTSDFLNRLETFPTWKEGWLLVTLDVPYLCTNIPHEEGIEACRSVLNQRSVCVPPTEDLCSLIEVILRNNVFGFNNKCYHQVALDDT